MVEKEEKGSVSLYMSKEAKIKLDTMAEELTHTKQGRSVTLDVIISFSNAHFVNLKAWYENQLKETEEVLNEK
jgi:hypothetical protein